MFKKYCIGTDPDRTPSLWLTQTNSAPHARFSLNDNINAGIDWVGNGLSLNKWYHLGYTLSQKEKRLDFYIDGDWAGFQSIQKVQTEQIVFSKGPLYIGNDLTWIQLLVKWGMIDNKINCRNWQTLKMVALLNSKFRYYNWRLSADEVNADFLVGCFQNFIKVLFLWLFTMGL